jgi:hypothetical protein
MADNIVKVLFELETESNKLRSDLNKVNQELTQTEGKAKQSASAFGAMADGLRGIAQQAGLGGLVATFDGVTSGVTAVKKSVDGLQTGLKSATTQTTLLGRAFKAALGPISLVLAAVTTLSGAFLSTQRGADAFNRVLNVLSVTFNRIIGVLQDISFSIVDTFQKGPKEVFEAFKNLLISQVTNRVQGVIKLFSALGQTIKGAFDLDLNAIKAGLAEAANAQLQVITGIEDAGEGLVNFLKEGRDIAKQISDIEEEISIRQVTLRKEIAQINKERIKSREVENDVNRSLEERLAATRRTQQLADEIAAKQIGILELELQKTREINELNDTKRVDKQKEVDLEAQILELQTQAVQETLRSRSKEAGILKQILERNKQIKDEIFAQTAGRVEALEKEFNERILLLKEINANDEQTRKDVAELIALIEEQKAREISDLKKELALEQFETEVDLLNRQNELERLQLKESLLNFKGTEAEKAEFIKQQTAKQIDLLNTELEKLQTLDVILTEDEQLDLAIRIQKIKNEIADLGKEVEVVTDETIDDFTEKFTSSLDLIGQTFDQTFAIISNRTRAELDRINQALSQSERGIQDALELARRGNVEALEIERKRQEELERQRERAIQREEQQARRQIQIQQALAAAQILAEVFKPGGAITLPTKIALAGSLIGLLSTLVPAFEDGTLNAPGGLALTDEAGAELHFDKNWRLKDKGSKGGARLKMTEKGDKIIPAPISRMITDDMINAKQRKEEKQDFEKLIRQMKSDTKVVVDRNGLVVGIQGVKREMREIWR